MDYYSEYNYSSDDETGYDLIDPAMPDPMANNPHDINVWAANAVHHLETQLDQYAAMRDEVEQKEIPLFAPPASEVVVYTELPHWMPALRCSLSRPAGWTNEMMDDLNRKLQQGEDRAMGRAENLDQRELVVGKVAAEMLRKRFGENFESAEVKEARLEKENRTLQEELSGVYEQIGRQEVHHKEKKQNYKARIAELENSLQESSQLKVLLQKQDEEIKVLKFLYENDKIIRESALEKLKRGESDIKTREKSELTLLRELIVIDSVLFAIIFIWFLSGAKFYLPLGFLLFFIVLTTLYVMYDEWTISKSGQLDIKSSVKTFIDLATTVMSDADRVRMATTTTATSSTEVMTPDHLKPRTVLLKKEKGSFGISIYGSHIFAVKNGGAAERAGIQAGDQIMAIDDIAYASSEEITKKIEQASDEIKMVVRFNLVSRKDAL